VPQLNDCLPEDTIFRYPIRHGLVYWRTEVVPIALLRLGIPCWGESRRLGIPIDGKLAGRFGLPSVGWPAFFANSFPAFQLHVILPSPCPRSRISCCTIFLQNHPGATVLGLLSFVADPSCLHFVFGGLLNQSRQQSNICCSPRHITPAYTRTQITTDQLPESMMCMATTAENDSGESASGTTQKSLKRACDCCRKRKVRCDGDSPCGPCRKATIRCAYLQAPKKKGPKGLRSARVLHALRKIDQSATLTPDGPLSPGILQDGLNQWYGSSSSSPIPLSNHSAIDGAMPTSTPAEPLTTGYGYYGPPEPQSYAMPSQTGSRALSIDQSMSQLWPTHPPQPQSYYAPPLRPQPAVPRIPNQRFLPYVQLFFEHLYFIMPVVDEQIYLDPYMYNSTNYMPPETYAFLCALCAATIVQLDAATAVPQMEPLPSRPTSAAEMFIEECLKVRQEVDYIGNPTTVTVMTSFFIFAYYGNKENSDKAWHYLQESISFIETLEMDDENSMLKLDQLEAQWRRRLYWLLFITERYFDLSSPSIFPPTDTHSQSILDTTSQELPLTSYH
jgi:hypothetical protein